jgi:deazaflavin-dependent oxidoreductase (nitroreductase family)
MPVPDAWRDAEFYYVTTTGRTTGRAHTVEIWCAARGDTLYLLAGGGDGSDTVQNIRAGGPVTVRVADETRPATAYVVSDPAEDAVARRVVVEKYAPGYGGSLDSWGRTALPVAIVPALPGTAAEPGR